MSTLKSWLGSSHQRVDICADEVVDLLSLFGLEIQFGLLDQVTNVENEGRSRMTPRRNISVRMSRKHLE